MNPETNKFEKLKADVGLQEKLDDQLSVIQNALVRPDGTPVPKHWSIFTEGEDVVVKDYTFKVAHIGESYLVLEPVGIPKIGKGKEYG